MSEYAGNSVLHGLTGLDKPWRSAGRSRAHKLLLLLARSVPLSLAYYLLVVMSLKLRLSTSTLSLLWPSNALLVATLVLSAKRHWWVYLLAVIPAHIAGMISYDIGLWWVAYQVTANSALAIASAS